MASARPVLSRLCYRRARAGVRTRDARLISRPGDSPTSGFHDECLKGDVQFSPGFMKPSRVWPFGSDSSFGSAGSGGSLGFADPSAGIGYAYVMSQIGTALTGDPGTWRSERRSIPLFRPREVGWETTGRLAQTSSGRKDS